MYVSSLLLSHTPTGQEQVPQDEAHGGCCDEFVRDLGHRLPVNLGVAGSSSPYDVIIYLFCTELLLYNCLIEVELVT
jgi:hypothetical protein